MGKLSAFLLGSLEVHVALCHGHRGEIAMLMAACNVCASVQCGRLWRTIKLDGGSGFFGLFYFFFPIRGKVENVKCY